MRARATQRGRKMGFRPVRPPEAHIWNTLLVSCSCVVFNMRQNEVHSFAYFVWGCRPVTKQYSLVPVVISLTDHREVCPPTQGEAASVPQLAITGVTGLPLPQSYSQISWDNVTVSKPLTRKQFIIWSSYKDTRTGVITRPKLLKITEMLGFKKRKHQKLWTVKHVFNLNHIVEGPIVLIIITLYIFFLIHENADHKSLYLKCKKCFNCNKQEVMKINVDEWLN